MFGSTFTDITDTLKDIPTSIIMPMKNYDYSREFSIKEEIDEESEIIIEGKADSFKFFQSDSDYIKVEGKIFISSDDNQKELKFPELNIVKDGKKIKLISNGNSVDHYRIEADIWIPNQMSLECSTKSGNIETSYISGNSSLHSKLGKIVVSNHSGNVNTSTKGGTIDIKNHSGDINAEVKNGSLIVNKIDGDSNLKCQNGLIELVEPLGLVNISSKMGTIKVNFGNEIADKKHSINSKTGIVNLHFKEQSDAKVIATTKLGNVIVDPIFKNKNGLVKIGDGGPEISVETKIGSITISRYN